MHAPQQLFALMLTTALTAAVSAGEPAPHVRLNELARTSVETGCVSYRQIAEAVYGDALDDVVATKQAWRASHPNAKWTSEYEWLLGVAVNVRVAPPTHANSGEIAADYKLETNTATIPSASAGALLAHEVAHGLTRRSIRSDEQKQFVDARLDLAVAPPRGSFARESGFNLEWLSYVATQCEFEVRLQALNRYYFELENHVIDTPSTALRAIVALGVDLEPGEVVDACRGAGETLSRAEAQAVCTAPRFVWSSGPECFRNADDLRKALQMATAWNPDIRQTLLAKIALEAPGHF